MTIVIYHNPECGTSRNTLEMIRASGEGLNCIQKDPVIALNIEPYLFG